MTKPDQMMSVPGERSVKEWVGATPDTPVPPRVKLRVLKRYRYRCYLSKIEIKPGDKWDVDHVLAIINGGENRESNLAPALKVKHVEKTKVDLSIKAKRDKSHKKRFGITKPKKSMPGSKASGVRICLDGTVICRRTGKVLNRREEV